MGRRTLLLIASILVAAVGTGVVALYANSAQDRALQDSKPVVVWYALKDIPQGSDLKTALASAEQRTVTSSATPGDPLPLRPNLPDQTTNRLIGAGTILSTSMFSAPGQQDAGNPLGLEDNKLAVSLTVTDVARVAGFAGPGSWVALYVTREDLENKDKQRTSLLFQKPVEVLKVAAAGAAGPTPGQTLVTLNVSQAQAERLILAIQTESNIYMALVKDKSVQLDQDNPISEDQLQTAGGS